MGTNPTKAADNMYCRCRKAAAQWNDRLNSREGAAEALDLSVSTLADYELDNTRPPVETVVRMADLYRAPELLNFFCTRACPIGRRSLQQLEVKALDRSILEIVHALGSGGDIREDLLDITADGIIDAQERPRLKADLEALGTIERRIAELRLCLEKRMGKELVENAGKSCQG